MNNRLIKKNKIYLKNPRVAMLSDARFPFSGADTQQVMKNTEALCEAGVDLCLVAPRRYGSFFKSKKKRQQELVDFYNLKKPLPMIQLPGFPAAKFRLEKFSHNLIAPFYALFKGFDVVYTRQPSTLFVSFLIGKRVVFETYRLFGSEHPRIFSSLSCFFNHERFLGCITHSSISKNDLVKAGVPENKVVVMYNGYDKKEVEPAISREDARKKLGLSNEGAYAVYAGNMQPSKGLEFVLDIAEKTENVTYLLVGGEPQHIERLKLYAAGKKLKNIVFAGHKNNREVAQYLYASDFLIIPPTTKALDKGRTVLPIKLYIYLASGRAILAPDQSDIKELLVSGVNSLLVEPDNIEACVAAVNRLVRDRELNNRIADEAGRLSREYTWESRGIKIRDWIYGKWDGGLGGIANYLGLM